MSELLNRTEKAIYTMIKRTNNSENSKKRIPYEYNVNYFKNIDTEEKAYWLGFIYADGCVSVGKGENKRLKIALQKSDEGHLRKFVDSIDGNVQVKIKKAMLNGVDYGCCEVQISGNELCSDLINLGVVPNKTKKLSMPNIREDLKKHFIRGYIDGDGCLYLGRRKAYVGYRYSVEIVGYNCTILDEINDFFNENGIDSKIYFKRENNSKVGVYSKKSIFKLIDYIYVGSKIYLDRKYEQALLIRST